MNTHTHIDTHPIDSISLENIDKYNYWFKSLEKERIVWKSIGYKEFEISSILYLKFICELCM